MIDWSKLESYQGNKHRSFEVLCYIIAKELYSTKGVFTSVDDSGGGDGVEFYLTLPNGDQWGWQAKFYYPGKRLSVSNRKNSIYESLDLSCKVHPNLKKWFLCTPTDFTTGEQALFAETLPNSIPENMDVELVHWGDSEFHEWLSKPNFIGILNYFFGDLVLNFDRFKAQVQNSIESIKEKFCPELHTDTDIDSIIHGYLGDKFSAQFLKEQLDNLQNEVDELNEAIEELKKNKPFEMDWGNTKSHLISDAEKIQRYFSEIIGALKLIFDLLSEQRLDQIDLESLNALYNKVDEALKTYSEVESSINLTKIAYSGEEEDRDRILQDAEMIIGIPGGITGRLLDRLYVLIESEFLEIF